MKIRIEIKTPDGQAEGVIHGKGFTVNVLRRLLGINLKHQTIKVNAENNLISWWVDDDPRSCMKIIRNVQLYDTIVSGIFKSKMLNKALKKHTTEEEREELKHMLKNMTKIRVVSE